MAGDDLRVVDIQTGQLSTLASYKLVACAVETILTYAVLLVVLVGQRVHIVDCGNRLVERGVEYRNLRHARQHLFDREHTLKICGVVERSNRKERTNLLLNILIYNAALGEELTTVSHTMTYSLNLIERSDNAVLSIGQCVEYKADTGCMIGNSLHQRVGILT